MLSSIPYRYRILTLLFFLATLTYLDRICISIVGVRIMSEFHLSNEQFGWVLGAFSLAYALFEIPSGVLGDRIGPRAVFIRIVLFWSFFTALTGLVTGLISLLIVRFLFGIGESGTYPNCSIVMSRWFPAKEMGRAFIGVGLGQYAGSAIAPYLIKPIADSYGWRMPFFVNGAIGLLWVLACYWWFRNFPSEMKNISPEEKLKIESTCRYQKHAHSLSWKVILKNRTVWALSFMYFTFQWANYFFVAWMPVYLEKGRHFTEEEVKPIISSIFIAPMLGLFIAGFFSDWLVKKKGLRFGRRFIGMTGFAVCASLIFSAAIIINNDLAVAALIIANGFYGFTVMTCYSVCTDIGKNNAGTVTGAMNFCGQMGAFFLAIIFGKIADVTHSFEYPLFAVAAVLGVGFLLWLLIDPLQQLKESIKEQTNAEILRL